MLPRLPSRETVKGLKAAFAYNYNDDRHAFLALSEASDRHWSTAASTDGHVRRTRE